MGEALFRYRLAVIVGFFGAAVGYAMFASRHAELIGGTPLLSSTTTLFGLQNAQLVSGLAALVAFALRMSGEARLGSVVYGQSASKRVVTGGPFRLLRHPLYLGAWLFFIAAVMPYVAPVVLAAFALAFAAALVSIAAYEERALAAELGAAWTRYAAAVPRFIGLPRAVDDDGVKLTARAIGYATAGNLGLLSVGVIRTLWGVGVEQKGMRTANGALLLAWVLIVIVRRVWHR